MVEDRRLSKIKVLIGQKRFGEAEKILSNLITEDSNNVHFLSLLAEVYLQQDKYEKASSIIQNAIGISPDEAHLYYVKSRIAILQDDLITGEKNINHAIQLDPNDANYFALLSKIKLGKKQFEEALKTANKALEIDPENILALNTRSSALIKLNRSDESFETIEGALREDPNNAYSHANYGWGLLEKGNHKKALKHFKEALSNDPNFDYAQLGMIEALKAANPLYRLFLKYQFFMSNLTAKNQWGVIIALYFGFRGLKTLARSNEALQPYLIPVIIALALIFFSTWIIEPLSNLFLRFNTYGQLLLDKKEKMSSNFVAISLGIFLVGVLSYLISWDNRMLIIAVFGFTMMLPLAMMFSSSKNEHVLLNYTIALIIIGLIAIGLTFWTGEMFNTMTIVYILGFIAFQWIANYIMIKEDNV